MPAPRLVIGVGNPSRGDDALGPRFLEALADRWSEAIAAGAVELLTDFQLQIEHALDLVGRRQVIFVDAERGLDAPYALRPVLPTVAPVYTTHVLAPAAVLAVYANLEGPPPPAWVLGLRAESFELGAGLSPRAEEALREALPAFLRWAEAEPGR